MWFGNIRLFLLLLLFVVVVVVVVCWLVGAIPSCRVAVVGTTVFGCRCLSLLLVLESA